MKTIRQGSFETNSSSTHAIVIPKEVLNAEYDLCDSLEHAYEFGREESRIVDNWDEKLAYIYIILQDFKGWNRDESGNDKRHINITTESIKNFKKRVNKIYKEILEIVEYKPYEGDPKPNDIFKYVDKGEWSFVDHVEDFDTNGFLNKILEDDEFLKRFIFNRESYITVGGDEYRGFNIKTIGFEYDYKSHYINHGTKDEPDYENTGEFWTKLKEYEKTHDVYLKGN